MAKTPKLQKEKPVVGVKIYVFASKSLTNIWAGIGSRRWAIASSQAQMPGTATKAAKVRIGALGVLYCSATKSVTTPFLITSHPDKKATVTNIWPEEWHFPFGITALGSPTRSIHKDILASDLPSVRLTGKKWNRILIVQPQFVFQTCDLSEEDWEFLYSRLRHD
jgi:hypothetical protein